MLLARTRKLMLFVMSFAALMLVMPNFAAAQPFALQEEESVSAVEGNSYTSPSFGYAITWNRDWSVSDEENTADYNKLVLENGVATVYLEGVADSSDVDTCVQTLVANLKETEGVSRVRQLKENGEPVGGTAPGQAWAVYTLTYTGSDGSKVDFAEYIDCRSIVEGESLLVITMLTPVDDLESQIEPLNTLLEGLSLDGSTGTDNGDNGDSDDNGDVVATGDLVDFIMLSAADIDDFWEREFPLLSGGKAYEPPASVIPFDQAIDTDCGTANVGEIGPFYCPPDQTIYYDLAYGESQVETFGSTSVVAVAMAHEVGHHIQNLMEWEECTATPCLDPTQMTSQEIELQADCFAGAWVADAETRERMGSFDVETNIAQFAFYLGDESGGGTADPGVHGEGARRVYLFLTGYYNGVLECLKVSSATDPARAGGDSEPADETAANPTKEPTSEPDSALIQIGDTFEVQFKAATVTMNVTSTETATSLGGDFDAKGAYLVIYFSVASDAPAPFPYDDFIVTDSDGIEYDVDADATDALLKTSDSLPDGIAQELDPGTTYNLAIIFDVAADASGFVFGTTDGETRVELDI